MNPALRIARYCVAYNDVRWISRFPTPLLQAHDTQRHGTTPRNVSLVPVASETPISLLQRLTDAAATALHRLVVLATRLRHMSANEVYVRHMLSEQVGISPRVLDAMAVRPEHRFIFRLSVRHSIEPVVSYLRSQGLTGSALALVLTQAPQMLARDVDEHLIPLCTFLKTYLGSRAMGALVNYPAIGEVSPIALQAAATTLLMADHAIHKASLVGDASSVGCRRSVSCTLPDNHAGKCTRRPGKKRRDPPQGSDSGTDNRNANEAVDDGQGGVRQLGVADVAYMLWQHPALYVRFAKCVEDVGVDALAWEECDDAATNLAMALWEARRLGKDSKQTLSAEEQLRRAVMTFVETACSRQKETTLN
jgi:hypothetical protein